MKTVILNNVEVNTLASIELIDAYNKLIPEDFININVIYCIHNKINNKNYIGQTIEFRNRFSDSYIGHFKDYNKFISGNLNDKRILYKAWAKYGLEAFTVYIIDTGKDREELNEKEMYWIKTLHTCTKDPECLGYNLSWGADDMGVTDPESIKKSLQTRLEKYGDYCTNCHTQEAYDKGNETKIQRYGHGGFINAFTPEANEKRKQTNLRKYGTPYGPRMSEEGLERMIQKKIDLYGDKMGTCNTPENRIKAKKHEAITNLFKSISNNLSLYQKTENWEEYQNQTIKRYKTYKEAQNHLIKIINLYDELKIDSRWTKELDSVFSDIKNEDKENLIQKVEQNITKYKEISKKQKDEKIKNIDFSYGIITKTINLLNSVLSSNPEIKTWEQYKNYTILHSSRPIKGKQKINRFIDNLPKLKQDPRWTKEFESIFGNITEKDKYDNITTK